MSSLESHKDAVRQARDWVERLDREQAPPGLRQLAERALTEAQKEHDTLHKALHS